MCESHAAQDVGGLGELDVVIADDFNAIAPGVAKVEEGPSERGDASRFERFAGSLLVLDNEAEMASVVGGLLAALLQRDELVAQIDKRHGVALAAQLKAKEAAVECQRLLDVADLERNVIEPHDARFVRSSHGTSTPLTTAALVFEFAGTTRSYRNELQ